MEPERKEIRVTLTFSVDPDTSQEVLRQYVEEQLNGQHTKYRIDVDERWPNRNVDVSRMTDKEIEDAVRVAGRAMGSYQYYVNAQIDRCLEDRAGVIAYYDVANKVVKAYYRRADER